MKHIKDNITIGSNIKHYRKLNKLTQKELGGLIGKTESSVQKMSPVLLKSLEVYYIKLLLFLMCIY